MQVLHPEPGIWYVNHVGQLLQVRVVLLVEKVASRVLIEYINGRQESFNIEGWFKLKLSLHSQESAAQAERNNKNILVE